MTTYAQEHSKAETKKKHGKGKGLNSFGPTWTGARGWGSILPFLIQEALEKTIVKVTFETNYKRFHDVLF